MELRYECREYQDHDGFGPYTRELHIIASPMGEARIMDGLEALAAEEFQLCGPDPKSLHWATYSRGQRVRQGEGICAPTPDELAAWDAIAAELAQRIANMPKRPRYIRFGALPKGGRSRNYAEGRLEKGISCYRAAFNPISDLWMFDTQATSPVAAVEAAFGAYDRALLCQGTEVGIGSDGEPLLADVRIIGELEYVGNGFRLKAQ